MIHTVGFKTLAVHHQSHGESFDSFFYSAHPSKEGKLVVRSYLCNDIIIIIIAIIIIIIIILLLESIAIFYYYYEWPTQEDVEKFFLLSLGQ